MEKLIVKHFGPIKDAEIILRKFNILIGHTSTGKSTIAKLFSIFNSSVFLAIGDGDFNSFEDLLNKYNIGFPFDNNTNIIFNKEQYTWEISNGYLKTNWKDSEIVSLSQEPVSSTNFIKRLQILSQEDPLLKKRIEDFILFPLMKTVLEEDNPNNEVLADVVKKVFLNESKNDYEPIYIPAERILISIFTNSIYSLLKEEVNIPLCIKDFGSLYQSAKTKLSHLIIEFMDAEVNFEEKKDDTLILKKENKKLSLTESSSGFQSMVPFLTVLDYYTNDDISAVEENIVKLFVIEEPELNLFPNVQVDIIQHIIKKINSSSKNNIIITTHSPYVLSVFDNSVLAKDIEVEGKGEKASEILSPDTWIDLKNISSYYFDENGIVKDIIDKEYSSVGAEYIDQASNTTGEIYDRLSELIY